MLLFLPVFLSIAIMIGYTLGRENDNAIVCQGGQANFPDVTNNQSLGMSNILDPRLRPVAEKGEKIGKLNGEFSSSLRDIIMGFIPAVSTNVHRSDPASDRIMPKNLSRKGRKEWKAENLIKPTKISNDTPPFVAALEKAQSQVFASIRATSADVEKYYERQKDTYKKTLTELDRKHYIYLLSSLGIPYIVFENVDSLALQTYTDQYMQRKDHVLTQYNYVSDMVRERVIAYIKEVLDTLTREPSLGYESYLLHKSKIVNRLKEIYNHACFKNTVPVQPGYIVHVFKHELKKAGMKNEFRGFINQPIHKFLNGVFSEVYGAHAMQYIMQSAKQDGIQIHDVSLEDESKALLDIHARSDEQYYVSISPTTQFIQSVDFKSFADGLPSLVPVSENDVAYNDHIHLTKKFIPEQLHSLPIYPLEFRVGMPAYFRGTLYTQDIFNKEFTMFYEQYKEYLAQQGLIR